MRKQKLIFLYCSHPTCSQKKKRKKNGNAPPNSYQSYNLFTIYHSNGLIEHWKFFAKLSQPKPHQFIHHLPYSSALEKNCYVQVTIQMSGGQNTKQKQKENTFRWIDLEENSWLGCCRYTLTGKDHIKQALLKYIKYNAERRILQKTKAVKYGF